MGGHIFSEEGMGNGLGGGGGEELGGVGGGVRGGFVLGMWNEQKIS